MENKRGLDVVKIFDDENYSFGRMISASKSGYKRMYPEHDVYFNGNIFTIENGKIFWGDIDYTKDEETLQRIANKMQKDLYILYEMDGRFENEDLEEKQIKAKAKHIIKFDPDYIQTDTENKYNYTFEDLKGDIESINKNF